MSASNKILQAAAGNAAGEAVYVEDVFATHLYEGTGATQTIENGIALGDSNYGSSVEFDGVGDYLSRSSGLSSHANSNTFTLSIWVFNETPSGFARIFGIKNSSGSNNVLYLQISSSNALSLATLTDGASTIQAIDDSQGYTVPANQWSHILVSANTSTSTWHLSINDSYSSVTPQKPLGYTDAVAFSTSSGSTVGTLYGGYFKGRITQLYLDNTFRDLSQTSVRRTFITSDGTPATGLASLNPILYLPLDDTNSIGTNSGTGGAYTVNGSPTQLSEGGPYEESGFGKGGLIWTKARSSSSLYHTLRDTERGTLKYLQSNATDAEGTNNAGTNIYQVNSNGYQLGLGAQVNGSGNDYVSWTFRKQAGFFDVVTYTGNGDSSLGAGDGSTQTISHNLGSAPGLIIVKDTGNSSDWIVFHRSLGSTHYIKLNTTGAGVDFDGYWNDTDPTSTEFTVGTHYYVNGSGNNFVAYLFAHDDQSFGDDSDESIIKCGSYTGDGGAGTTEVNLGFEPQWILVKATSAADNWFIIDNMRGWATESNTSNDAYLLPNASNAESTGGFLDITATGFKTTLFSNVNVSGRTYAYVAIRRPMKTPEAGTDVFAIDTMGSTGDGNLPAFRAGFPPDFALFREIDATYDTRAYDRLRDAAYLLTTSTSAEAGSGTKYWSHMNGFYNATATLSDYYAWMFKRATGFFDVICHSGSGYNTNVKHNLGVVPELVISKTRSASGFGSDLDKWYVWSSAVSGSGNNAFGFLNETGTTTNSFFASSPTSTDLYLHGNVAYSGDSLVKYLFATVAGVSKVGSYTGTGSQLAIDCGFSSGARFVLIKRTDTAEDWFVWDSTRGIVAGNDPYLLLNSTAAQTTTADLIDPNSSGFEVTNQSGAVNASGGTYIFLAIA